LGTGICSADGVDAAIIIAGSLASVCGVGATGEVEAIHAVDESAVRAWRLQTARQKASIDSLGVLGQRLVVEKVGKVDELGLPAAGISSISTRPEIGRDVGGSGDAGRRVGAGIGACTCPIGSDQMRSDGIGWDRARNEGRTEKETMSGKKGKGDHA
jgi:hypothetical protein